MSATRRLSTFGHASVLGLGALRRSKLHWEFPSPKPAGKPYVLNLYCNTFGVYSAVIRILKKVNKIKLDRFLKCADRCALETQITLEVLGDLTNESLEWKLSNKQLGTLRSGANTT